MRLSDFDTEYLERLRARFWAKVAKSGPDHCWEWAGATASIGYGHLSLSVQGNNIDAYAHRVSVLFRDGVLDDSLHVCHTCDNPPCVNPMHLFVGTAADNVRDAMKKGRRARLQGEKHGSSKLTRKQVIKIKELLKTDISKAEIGRRFGVARTTIKSIAYGDSWKHV